MTHLATVLQDGRHVPGERDLSLGHRIGRRLRARRHERRHHYHYDNQYRSHFALLEKLLRFGTRGFFYNLVVVRLSEYAPGILCQKPHSVKRSSAVINWQRASTADAR